MYLSDGQLEQAAALLEKAVALVPHDDLSRYHLALAYTRLNRTKDGCAGGSAIPAAASAASSAFRAACRARSP